MAQYRLGSSEELVTVARLKGWVHESGSEPIEPSLQTLPSVAFEGVEGGGCLAPRQVCLQSPTLLRLPNVLVHGGNLSLLIDDIAFPAGFAHSFWPSPAWVAGDQGRWSYDAVDPVKLEAPAATMLGVTSHFGHFFVDALERVLRPMPSGVTSGMPSLIAAADLLGTVSSGEDHGCVPQVADLMRALGCGSVLPRLHAVPARGDLIVPELWLWTLSATKPAVPVDAMLVLRQRLSPLWAASGRPGQASSASRGLFVARDAVRKRFILDQARLLPRLEQDFGLNVFTPEHHRVEDAARAFAGAGSVLLPIGSAKFNLAFCRPGTPVVCITPRGYARGDGGVVTMVRHMCHALGLPLAFFEVDIQRCEPLINSNLIIREQDIDPMLDLVDHLRDAGVVS